MSSRVTKDLTRLLDPSQMGIAELEGDELTSGAPALSERDPRKDDATYLIVRCCVRPRQRSTLCVPAP
jgi:hypothetical protein